MFPHTMKSALSRCNSHSSMRDAAPYIDERERVFLLWVSAWVETIFSLIAPQRNETMQIFANFLSIMFERL
jgi:hypothetical protein